MSRTEKQRTSQKPKPTPVVEFEDELEVDRTVDEMEIERLERENDTLKKILVEVTLERLEAQGKID
jgi:hypothetical protein